MIERLFDSVKVPPALPMPRAGGATRPTVLVSDDGAAWSEADVPLTQSGSVDVVAAGPDGVMALASGTTGASRPMVATSADGRSWRAIGLLGPVTDATDPQAIAGIPAGVGYAILGTVFRDAGAPAAWYGP